MLDEPGGSSEHELQLGAQAEQTRGDGELLLAGLETFGSSTIEFTVSLDETVSISEDFTIDRTVAVPINTTLPISTDGVGSAVCWASIACCRARSSSICAGDSHPRVLISKVNVFIDGASEPIPPG